MDVVIVSKTRMSGGAACVGGILARGCLVRLLDANGRNQASNTKLEVGQVYTITYSERPDKTPPHIEDILVDTMKHKFTVPTMDRLGKYLLLPRFKIKVWKGGAKELFDGKLHWTKSGSGFVSKSGEMPDNSVGFWIPDKDLNSNQNDGRVRYSYPHWRSLPFVGYQDPVNKIPAGTLIRVSLARWWVPEDAAGDEERCYLQLSGWYADLESNRRRTDNELLGEDEIPF